MSDDATRRERRNATRSYEDEKASITSPSPKRFAAFGEGRATPETVAMFCRVLRRRFPGA
jgi:hypothetical protein